MGNIFIENIMVGAFLSGLRLVLLSFIALNIATTALAQPEKNSLRGSIKQANDEMGLPDTTMLHGAISWHDLGICGKVSSMSTEEVLHMHTYTSKIPHANKLASNYYKFNKNGKLVYYRSDFRLGCEVDSYFYYKNRLIKSVKFENDTLREGVRSLQQTCKYVYKQGIIEKSIFSYGHNTPEEKLLFKYDKSGRMTEIVRLVPNRSKSPVTFQVSSIKNFLYDSKGRLMSVLDSIPNLPNSTVYDCTRYLLHYDDSVGAVEISKYDEYEVGNLTCKKVLRYNKNGYCIEEASFDRNNDSAVRLYITRNRNNDVVRVDNSEHRWFYFYEYIYDSAGNILREDSYDGDRSNPQVSITSEYKYFR